MQHFFMHCGTYDFTIKVVLSDKRDKVAEYINSITGLSLSGEDFTCRGKVIIHPNPTNSPIMWLPSYPISHREMATLNHELLHLVFQVMDWAGIKLSSYSEEAFTYLMTHLTVEFYKKAKRPRIKK